LYLGKCRIGEEETNTQRKENTTFHVAVVD
jgi:hypothetical protein